MTPTEPLYMCVSIDETDWLLHRGYRDHGRRQGQPRTALGITLCGKWVYDYITPFFMPECPECWRDAE